MPWPHARQYPPTLILLLSGVLAGAVAGNSWAQGTLYRCGNSYQSDPCPGGRTLNTAPAPDPQQQAEAQNAAESEARLARQLQQERRTREAKDRQHMATEPAGVGKRAANDEDDRLTDCRPDPETGRRQWSKRKKAHCAAQLKANRSSKHSSNSL